VLPGCPVHVNLGFNLCLVAAWEHASLLHGCPVHVNLGFNLCMGDGNMPGCCENRWLEPGYCRMTAQVPVPPRALQLAQLLIIIRQ